MPAALPLKLRSPSVPALCLDISFNIVNDNDIKSFIVLAGGVTFCQSDVLALMRNLTSTIVYSTNRTLGSADFVFKCGPGE